MGKFFTATIEGTLHSAYIFSTCVVVNLCDKFQSCKLNTNKRNNGYGPSNGFNYVVSQKNKFCLVFCAQYAMQLGNCISVLPTVFFTNIFKRFAEIELNIYQCLQNWQRHLGIYCTSFASGVIEGYFTFFRTSLIVEDRKYKYNILNMI